MASVTPDLQGYLNTCVFSALEIFFVDALYKLHYICYRSRNKVYHKLTFYLLTPLPSFHQLKN